MADLSRTVEIVFEGVDRLGTGVDSINSRIAGVTNGINSATAPLADFTKGLVSFEAGLIAAGIAVTGLSVKLAGDFDAQFKEIATLINEPIDALGSFKDQIQSYATTSTQSFDQVTSSVYTAISAGVDYRDSLALIAEAEKLAVAGKSDLGATTEVLVSTLNAYGASMDQAGKYSDLLFQTVKSGQTTLPELGQSLASVTGLAATAGVGFDELMSGVAALTATGSPTSEAITQIRGALSNIIKPTKQASDLADELGINFSASALQSKGLAGVLDEVAIATGGNVEQMSLLFGDVEALNGALTLTGNGAEKFKSTLLDMGAASGVTDVAFQKMSSTAEDGSQKIINAVQGLLISIGDPLLDEFNGVQSAIAGIFSALGSSVTDGQLEQFVSEIEGTFLSLEESLRSVAENMPAALEMADYSGYFDGIEKIKGAFSGLFDGVDLTTAEGLATLIGTIGTSFDLLSSYVAGAIEGIGPFVQQLAELGQFILSIDPDMVALIGTIGGLSVAITAVTSVVSGMGTALAALGGTGGIAAAATTVLGGLVTVLTGPVGIVAAVGAAAYAIYEMTDGFGTLNEQVEEVRLADVADEFNYIGKQGLKTLADLKDALRDGSVVWSDAKEAFIDAGEAVDAATDGMGSAVTKFDSDVSSGMESVSASVLTAQKQLSNSFQSMIDDAAKSGDMAAQLDSIAGQINAAFSAGEISTDQFDSLIMYMEEVESAGEKGAEALKQTAKASDDNQKSLIEAQEQAQKFEIAMADIASNERIKSFEMSVDLKTAQIEAETDRIKAAFSSIDNTVTSTGETIASLWETMAGASDGLGFADKWALGDDIAKENERRDEALQLQKELTEAQIAQLEARTRALQSGDGLIKITSDGLEPALEMIMWQVIEKVQLQANAEGAEMLVGL